MRRGARARTRGCSWGRLPSPRFVRPGGWAARSQSPRRPGSLLRDAQARLVGVQLPRPAHFVRLLVPLIGYLRHCLVYRELACKELRDRRVLIESGLRDAQVKDHVRALQARLDGAEVVLRRLLAHARVKPGLEVAEVRLTVRVEAGLADGD